MVALSQAASQGAALLVLSCLYRLLGGEPFGLLGMAAPLMALAEMLGAFGFPIAAVQREHVDESELTTLFWWSVGLSLVAGGVIAVAAQPLSALFSTPELAPFCWTLALAPVVSSFVRMHRALLERRLQFGRLTAMRLTAQLLAGGSAVFAAWRGWGVWSLVVQIYVDQLLFAALLWRFERWRPGPPVLASTARDMLRFSGLYSISSFLFFLSQNADRFVLGLLLGGSPAGRQVLGFYSQAYGLMTRPLNQICTPITALMLPALSRASGLQRATLCGDFFRAVGVLLLPAGAGLTVIAPDVMQVMGGAAWSAAGELLQLLAPILLVQGFISICGSVYAACGRTGALAWAASCYSLIVLLAIAGGAVWGRSGSSVDPLSEVRGVAVALTLCALGDRSALCRLLFGRCWRQSAPRRPRRCAGGLGGAGHGRRGRRIPDRPAGVGSSAGGSRFLCCCWWAEPAILQWPAATSCGWSAAGFSRRCKQRRRWTTSRRGPPPNSMALGELARHVFRQTFSASRFDRLDVAWLITSIGVLATAAAAAAVSWVRRRGWPWCWRPRPCWACLPWRRDGSSNRH